jgi:ArsR family transcriptional regulator
MNRVYQALAHPVRRQILVLLRQGDMTAGELAEHFDITKPTLSGHFAVLREAELVHSDRNGNSIRYHLNASVLEEALLTLLDAFSVAPPGGEPPPVKE